MRVAVMSRGNRLKSIQNLDVMNDNPGQISEMTKHKALIWREDAWSRKKP
ncbi:hypothetical protein KDA_66770 [Dictyobacter alpinus]|uniref:Uncharacterized protein n=1 Tax=Dictyobacter alpinus TaxID=2014873 RepID=A0A402BII7_9CHLR|nr:hypothetical protein KDA_66770 [Dictyobacter alpinus]